jgi:hypothetical protein
MKSQCQNGCCCHQIDNDAVVSCKCFPTWVRQLIKDASSTLCCQCHEPWVKGSVRSDFTIMFPCSLILVHVHVMDGWVHDKCAKAWDTIYYRKSNRHRICDRLPMGMDEAPKSMLIQAHKNCREKHKPLPGKQCGNCNTGAQEKCRLNKCSRCRRVRYCDAVCQREAWPEHKQYCVPREKKE